MKTIKDSAKESYQKDRLMSDLRLQSIESSYNTGFKRGIEFVQQWISVEEELPEVNSEVIAELVWDSGKKVKAALKYVDEDDCSWRTLDDNSELNYSLRVVKYRPIELK